ncbi:MAG TPA: hypothetical protein VGL70_13395 [Candidatus Binatia bacterium]
MKRFTAIIVLFLLAGCSASGARFDESRFATEPVPADKARLIFFRLEESPVGGPPARLEIDGVRVGGLKNRGFLVVDAVPGEREVAADIWSDSGRFALKMNLEAQRTYYLRVSRREEHHKYMALPLLFGLAGGVVAASLSDGKGPFKIEPIEAAEATKLLPEFRLSE